MNKLEKQKLIDTYNSMVVIRGKGHDVVKGTKYMVREDDLALGGGHTMQYTLETYIILLTNVTPVNLIKTLIKLK